jgi:hypothetical protein
MDNVAHAEQVVRRRCALGYERFWAPRAPRAAVSLMVSLGSEQAAIPSRTRDLSPTGVFVETTWRPAVGTTTSLRIVWGDDLVEASVSVVRHEAAGIAVRFITPEASFAWVVADILRAAGL